MVSEPIEFYFDFTDPYAYFTSLHVDEIGARHKRETVWKPVTGSVITNQTVEQSAEAATHAHGVYTMRDMARVARLHHIELNVMHPMASSLPADTAYIWLFDQAPRVAKNYAQAVFHAHWRLGQNIEDPAMIGDCAAAAGQDPETVIACMKEAPARDRLRTAQADALTSGIFAAPTIVVDGELFWGWDRMAMAEAWLENNGW